MDVGQQLLSWNEMARHSKEGATASAVLKEISFSYRHLRHTIDAPKSRRSKNPEVKLKLNEILWKSSFLEKVVVSLQEQMCTVFLLKHL